MNLYTIFSLGEVRKMQHKRKVFISNFDFLLINQYASHRDILQGNTFQAY